MGRAERLTKANPPGHDGGRQKVEMMITYEERQRLLEMLDAKDRPEDPDALLKWASQSFPNTTVGEFCDVVAEHAARLLENRDRLLAMSQHEQLIIEVARRDPDLDEDEPAFDALRRLAQRGDKDAAAILAQYETPLFHAVSHIVESALDAASDWVAIEQGHQQCKGGRELWQVVEEYIGAHDFDVMALLPEELRHGLNPVELLVAVNDEIADLKLTEAAPF